MNVLINYATPEFCRSRVLNTATGYLTGGFDKVIECSPEDIDRTFIHAAEPGHPATQAEPGRAGHRGCGGIR